MEPFGVPMATPPFADGPSPFTRFNPQGDFVPFVTNDRGDVIQARLNQVGEPQYFAFNDRGDQVMTTREHFDAISPQRQSEQAHAFWAAQQPGPSNGQNTQQPQRAVRDDRAAQPNPNSRQTTKRPQKDTKVDPPREVTFKKGNFYKWSEVLNGRRVEELRLLLPERWVAIKGPEGLGYDWVRHIDTVDYVTEPVSKHRFTRHLLLGQLDPSNIPESKKTYVNQSLDTAIRGLKGHVIFKKTVQELEGIQASVNASDFQTRYPFIHKLLSADPSMEDDFNTVTVFRNWIYLSNIVNETSETSELEGCRRISKMTFKVLKDVLEEELPVGWVGYYKKRGNVRVIDWSFRG